MSASSPLDLLNPAQRAAVLHEEGPAVVFAGAGSGKTRVITTRIWRLLSQGILPQQILAVTFTNKAAKEMKERLMAMAPAARTMDIGTFHSMAARWLREWANELGYGKDFTIYDEDDAQSALKGVVKERYPNYSREDQKLLKDYKKAIAKAKTLGFLPKAAYQEYNRHPHLFGRPPMDWIPVYERYQEVLVQANAMDFQDLLMNVLRLFQKASHVPKILQGRYRYVMVDEYQDTNQVQSQLISYLLSGKHNLFVVGDDDQSIYGWRGADPTNIIQFRETYPQAQIYHLEQNYRSTSRIVNAASQLIANNQSRAPKTLWTDNFPGDPIQYREEWDGEMEAVWIAHNIQKELKEFSYQDVAIFYRMNAHSRLLENELRRQGIPYRIYGGLSFYERAEIKDLTAYARCLINPQDNVAFSRIFNTPPRGFGKKAQELVTLKAQSDHLSLWDASIKIVNENPGGTFERKLAEFLTLMHHLRQMALGRTPLAELFTMLLDGVSYRKFLKERHPPKEGEEKMANVSEFISSLGDYELENPEGDLASWLRDVALMESQRTRDTFLPKDMETQGVTLMTLHLAKGLEFPRVYIAGVEEPLIPLSFGGEEPSQVEEERRLLYVGITRARKRLSMVGAKRRKVFNEWNVHSPSRFLKDLQGALS